MQPIFDKLASSDGVLAAVVTAILLTLAYFIRLIFAARSKVLWGLTEKNHFLVNEPDGSLSALQTENYLFHNVGRKAAEDLEIIFNFAPQHFEIFPHLPYSQVARPDGRIILTIKKLHARQFIRLAMFRVNGELPQITMVSFDAGHAGNVPFQTVRKFSALTNWTAVLLMVFGAISVLYWLVRFAIHVAI